MTGLDERQRGLLERVVVAARGTFETDLETILRGTFGIHPDGSKDDPSQLADVPAVRSSRSVFDDILRHLEASGADKPQSVQRLVREAAFTHLNRLIAIRVADAIGVLRPSLRAGVNSDGFKQFIELAPLLATSSLDDTGGYWTYLQRCADELASDAPALFDPRNPLVSFRPSKAAIDAVVRLLSDDSFADIWEGDDTFGWAYQFFNTGDERKQMRAESAAPRDSRELAVRNQFFTPSYVVRFLVQNTLGRRLIDAEPASALLDELPLLVDPPTAQGEPIALEDVKVLDPASGSGHFLLGCYEVLEAAWRLRGVSAADAAPRIVPCLWGVDIDPRAVQVAQAAVIFRARRSCGRAPLPPPNIVCATALPDDRAAWETSTADLDPTLRKLISAMRDALRDAPVLGSLLKVEQRLAQEIRTAVPFADETDEALLVTAGVARDNFGNAERAVLGALQRAADSATASAAEQLLAAQAGDAVRFVEACRQRYDAVLMNPPFGEAVAATKDYLKAAYPWIPTKDYNLLAAFVGRGVELCNPAGYMGAITSRSGLFIKTFEDWRTKVLLGNRLEVLADFGYGVMEQALVEAAAYVLSPKKPTSDHAAVFIRLLKDAERPSALASAITANREGREDSRVYRVDSARFSAVPGSPMSYWMGDSIRQLFQRLPRIEGGGGNARQGLASGDDFRFLRLFWEVDPEQIGRTQDESRAAKRWVPFAKGGEYRPCWSDIHLVLDWEHDGQRVRGYSGSRPQNTQYFFRPGLTWPLRTASSFGVRVLPSGCGFGHKGPALFVDGDLPAALAYMRSRLLQALLDATVAAGDEVTSGGASRSYEVGMVQNLPWAFADMASSEPFTRLGSELIQLAAQADFADETARWFVGPTWRGARSVREAADVELVTNEAAWLRAIELSGEVDELLLKHLSIDEAGRSYLDEEFGRHPNTYPLDELDAEDFAEIYSMSNDAMIDTVVERFGGSRVLTTLGHVADRRTEVLSHALRRHPRAVIETRRKLGVLPPGQLSTTASEIISWLVGCAFGRWDVRPVSAPAFDPVSPPPLVPAGARMGADGFPAMEGTAGYPLAIPTDGLFVDQLDHPLDLATAVERAAETAAEYGSDLAADAVRILEARSLRDFLAKQFFKAHVSRYSKSRRQAPVYWQLTVPGGGWSLWLYAPRFSREMLFAAGSTVEQRIASGHDKVRVLLGDQSLSARQQAKDVESERMLIAQLELLLADLRRLSALGWQPDLNDGYVLNAAPLAAWFPKNAWKQLGDELKAIKKGAYPWATIHQFREQL